MPSTTEAWRRRLVRAHWQRQERLQWTATVGPYTVVVEAGFEGHWRTLLHTKSRNDVALLVWADIHWAAAHMVGARSPVATIQSSDGSTWTVSCSGRRRRLECALDHAIATALSRL